jgi:hypothetical protein
MKNKFTPALKCCFITMALASLATLLSNGASYPYDNIVASDFFTEYPDQLEFPIILVQPLNQLVPAGASATFIVGAVNEPLAYQWMRNGVIIPGETNSSLTITNAQVANVGLYSCSVAKDLEIVPTRSAQLMVYINNSKVAMGKSSTSTSLNLYTQFTPVTVYATPVTSGGSSGTCPGSYAGYVNYAKAPTQGWGWAPDSGTINHTATDTNRMDTKLLYLGKLSDMGCDQTTVGVPDPTYSTKYRFTIYFTNNVPTNAYSIVLNGFDP